MVHAPPFLQPHEDLRRELVDIMPQLFATMHTGRERVDGRTLVVMDRRPDDEEQEILKQVVANLNCFELLAIKRSSAKGCAWCIFTRYRGYCLSIRIDDGRVASAYLTNYENRAPRDMQFELVLNRMRHFWGGDRELYWR